MLEADLQREYGVDLTDLYRGTLTLRRLHVLIDHLPPECATAREVGDVDDALTIWSVERLLLGRIVDELALLRFEYEAVHSEKGAQRDPPESVLPELDTSSRVVPLVRPTELGEFMKDFEEGSDSGD